MENNEKKYILKPELYNKLILFYVLNQINEEKTSICRNY
jgi:hypothetical protein